MRPHWDDVWLGVAHVVARRSLCARAQVGAVIVDSRYRIVSTGYNGPPHGYDHRNETCEAWCERSMTGETRESYSNCPSLHAEANALIAADRSIWQGGVLYVTGHVCSDCAKLIANAGLSRIVVQDDGVDREYREPTKQYALLRSLGVGVEVLPPFPHVDSIPNVYLEGRSMVTRIDGRWINVHPDSPPDDAVAVFLAQPLQDGLRTVRDQSEPR